MNIKDFIDTVPEDIWSEKDHKRVNAYLKKEAEKQYKENKEIGSQYEKIAGGTLKKVFRAKPIINILAIHPNGKETETDMAFVTKKGIFAIECKCHGWSYKHTQDTWIVTGNLNAQDDWTVTKPDRSRDTCGNAFAQNRHHLEALEPLIQGAAVSVHIKCILATNSRFNINDFGVTYTNENTDGFCEFPGTDICIARLPLHNSEGGLKAMKKWYKALPEVYTDEQVRAVTSLLESHVGTKQQLRAHEERLKVLN